MLASHRCLNANNGVYRSLWALYWTHSFLFSHCLGDKVSASVHLTELLFIHCMTDFVAVFQMFVFSFVLPVAEIRAYCYWW